MWRRQTSQAKTSQPHHSQAGQPCGHLVSLQGAWCPGLQKFPSIQGKPRLWEIFFSVIRRPEGAFQPMKTHGANKETQDPQRAPRTPGVRSQELHLCANRAGLGIRDYQSPELRAAVRSLCPEGSGRFLAPPPTSPPRSCQRQKVRGSHSACWGSTGGGLGRGWPLIDRQPTRPLPMPINASSC